MILTLFAVALGGCEAARDVGEAMGEIRTASGDFGYKCDDGTKLLARFQPGSGQAVLTLNDRTVWLDQEGSADGARYGTPEGWLFWTRGNDALFARPGGRQTDCRRS